MNALTERLGLRPPVTLHRASLPEWLRGWYVVARSRDLRRGEIRTVVMADEEVVIFRTMSGAIGAVDAHCPHMGAHLRHGRVRDEHIECALHCWTIKADGAWPVREQFGLVLLARGVGIEPPHAGDADFIWTSISPHDVAASWHGLVANAFDMPHLCTVHRRELTAPPRFSSTPGKCFSLQYVSRVRGRGLSDFVMKKISGDRINVTVQCHGAITVVETDLGFTHTAACLGMYPTPEGTRVFAAFGIRKGLFQQLRLWMTRWLFAAFLRRDIGVIEGMRLRTDVDDATLQALFDFVRSMSAA